MTKFMFICSLLFIFFGLFFTTLGIFELLFIRTDHYFFQKTKYVLAALGPLIIGYVLFKYTLKKVRYG